MTRPLIGITVNPRFSRSELPHDRISHTYIDAIQAAGGIPLLLPTNLKNEEVRALRGRLDGILLSGGGDIDPKRFGGVPSRRIGNVFAARDDLEFNLVQLSTEANLPLLGICRGAQVINVALGGTLYTDIPEQYSTEINHNGSLEDRPHDFLAHEVRIIEGTKLSSILKKPLMRVNSFHHQAILEPAKKLMVSAYSSDGLIEGVELPEHKFFIGVQWHPECLPLLPEQRSLFEAFIQIL